MNHLSEDTDFKEFIKIINTNKLIILDFYADWCNPCIKLTPYLIKLANKYKKAIFYKINIENNEDIAQQFDITCMPTIIFLKNKSILDKLNIDNLENSDNDDDYYVLDKIEGLDIDKIIKCIEKHI